MSKLSKCELVCYTIVMVVGILSSIVLGLNGIGAYAAPAFLAVIFVVVMNIAQSNRMFSKY